MGAEASTSEVLNKAADLIEQRGWATGAAAWGDGSGLCLEGGIIAALDVDVFPLTENGNGAPMSDSEFRSCPAYRAVRDYLVSTDSIDTDDELWEFNDDSAAERVIGVLRATALIEAARERESVEV
jgi:hypothetical protein